MSSGGKKRWLVKLGSGKILGPFETGDVLQRISRGEFSGDEQISVYPKTEWKPMTQTPEFYDKLIELLEGAQEDDVKESANTPFVVEPPVVQSQSKRGRAERVSHHQRKQKKKKLDRDSEGASVSGDVIELKKRSDVEKKVSNKKRGVPVLLALIVLLLGVYLLLFDNTREKNLVRLLAPRPADKTTLSKERSQQLKAKADSFYFYDNSSGLMTAQDTYVQLIEGDPKNSAAHMMLCLTYEALWGLSYQDSRDLNVLTQVIQLASQINPASVESAICKAVDLFIRGKNLEASSVVDTLIEILGGSETPPAPAYYIKGLILENEGDYAGAAGYLQSAEQVWPQWIRAFAIEGRVLTKMNAHSEAMQRFQQILKGNPKHALSLIWSGKIEFQHFQNIENASTYFDQGLSTKEILPRRLEAMAYFGRAEIALQQNNQSEAVKWAKKAYELNASLQEARAIIVQYEGSSGLTNTRRGDRQLIYEGDQLVREGDCNAAQVYYKQAFEMNPKNGRAAMKAAECLWDLSLSTDAIEMLNKAIQVDSKLIDAYVLLSDYYTRRYNFEAAGLILQTAGQIDPRNYKVYRGTALLELRRNNLKGSVSAANAAIQLYGADVESHVIASRALIGLGQFPKALESATKAVELDLSNRKAQVALAEAIYGTHGPTSAIDYLNQLVETYPQIGEYRLALGQAYAKNESYAEAEAIFEQVTRLESKPKKALIELGRVRQKQEKYKDAIAAFYQAAALDPADVEALFMAGILFLDTNKPKLAKKEFNRVIRVNKNYPRVYYFMGQAALRAGSIIEAIELAREEARRNPNLADPYILLAEAYAKQKNWALCAREYQKVVRLRSEGADIYVKMARCYRKSNNLEAAQSIIGIAGQQESGNPRVWKEQGQIYETMGQKIRAIEAYEQYLVLAPNAPDFQQVRNRINRLSQ